MYSRHVVTISLTWSRISETSRTGVFEVAHLVRLGLRRHHDKEHLDEHGTERVERLDKLAPGEEPVGLGELSGLDVVQVERRQGEYLAHLGGLGVSADVELEWWEGWVGGNMDVGRGVCLKEEGFERGEIDRGDLSVE
jgi:hypothetical protein